MILINILKLFTFGPEPPGPVLKPGRRAVVDIADSACEQLPKLSFLTPLGTRTWCVGRPGGAAAPQGEAQSGARRRGKSGPKNHSVPTLSSDRRV